MMGQLKAGLGSKDRYVNLLALRAYVQILVMCRSRSKEIGNLPTLCWIQKEIVGSGKDRENEILSIK